MEPLKRLFSRIIEKLAVIYPLWLMSVVFVQLRYRYRALYNGLRVNKRSVAELHSFRRNIHRLEKGLSYEVPKGIFAEDYISETVRQLNIGRTQNLFDSDTLDWAEAVLSKYFDTVEASSVVKKARAEFEALNTRNVHSTWVPYPSHTRGNLAVQYDDMYRIALYRRSVRTYDDRPVDPKIVCCAMEIAALSPSACNRQAFRFMLFTDRDTVKQISLIPGGVAGYSLPSIVVVVGCYRGYFDPRDINAPVIDASLASMSFLFALETLGLSSVCINWPNLPDRERRIREVIRLRDDEFVVMLIGIGYAKDTAIIPYSKKKPVSELLSVNPTTRKAKV